MEDFLLWGLFLVGMSFALYILTLKARFSNQSEDWLEVTLKELSLDNDNVELLNYSSNNLTYRNMLIYTKDDYIYILNKGSKLIEKILKKDILDIDLQIYSTEKNVKKLIALTSTYDRRVNMTGIELKITTINNTYIIPFMVDGKDANKVMVFNKNKLVDDVNRYKLLIERDIENINSKNI